MGQAYYQTERCPIINISSLDRNGLSELIRENFTDMSHDILKNAQAVREYHFGKKVYLRGLIEFTNHCKNDCFYCGIRKSSHSVKRYRLTKEQILSCCEKGYASGYRTFVLQGGEDPYYNTVRMSDIISAIKDKFPDTALTISFGEHSKNVYKSYFDAGADRYLLRHESASPEHYEKLHPPEMAISKRKECLYALKEIGFQVGAGFMVGSPHQTCDNLAEDLLFIKELKPHMVGIGPFIPAKKTPFENFPAGSLNLTLLMISLTRILLPNVLLPSTTAIGTIHKNGREMGLLAGGNVVMPNLTPLDVRCDYALYNNKISLTDDAEKCRLDIERFVKNAGFEVSLSRGDHPGFIL